MSDFRDEHTNQAEEELGHLEDPKEAEPDKRRSKAADPRELPRPLYRIKASHSNETFYAYFPPPKAQSGAQAAAQASDPASTEGPSPEELETGGEDYSLGLAAEEADEAPEAAPAVSEADTQAVDPEENAASLAAQVYIAPRTMVVVPTRYGRDVCELQGIVQDPGPIGKDDVIAIERIATDDDLRKVEANREREKKAFETCKQKIAVRNLPMKLVSAHYLLEEPKVLFYFSAESRVDFRELVKDLVSVFKIRIELRQIGVRDEARVTGGCGVCGRVLCCHGVTDKLVPVSIKMAKDQNLSLNSMKISGPCGRLLCCLAYEFGFYREARREMPSEGARFQYEGVLFRVIEVNALSGSVKIAGEDGRILDMPATRFANSEGRWRVKDEEKAQ
jgi:cell fate regulator YaaT (PSP1 superfamily)